MPHPTPEEIRQHEIRSVEIEVGHPATGIELAQKLTAEYPFHLVLVQAGAFLHGFDKTAYALHRLKDYKLKLVGTNEEPHIQAGLPCRGHKRRLWKILDEFGIPYIVAIGNLKGGYEVFQSEKPKQQCKVLVATTDKIVGDVISDLRKYRELNAIAVTQMLKDPDCGPFVLKEQVLSLDTLLIQDIAKLPRDLRCCFGENLRQTMHRISRATMAYGLSTRKPTVLRNLSADVDLLKHYLSQSQKLGQLKKSFKHRAAQAVEIGRLVGGLIRKQEAS